LALGLAALRDWKIYVEFISPGYQQSNIARLQHLDSLELDLKCKRVLEVGAGIGDHTLFYLYRGCQVLPTDARPNLVRFISRRLGISAEQIDVERRPQQIENFGKFDILHCYGLLYHLSNPEGFLKSASRVADTLILETCVSPGSGSSVATIVEDSAIPSQAVHGCGSRPTRRWIFDTLGQYFDHVYSTTTQPRHDDFPKDWSVVPHELLTLRRAVFVASHNPLQSQKLTTNLPIKHEDW